MKIGDEIKQAHFNSIQQKAGMNLIFTANWLSNKYASALKPLDLSLQQLNVLAILNGQPKHTAPVNLIRERMIDRMPNISRLLNKLMEKKLIAKGRTLDDQRIVQIKLTDAGQNAASKGREIFESVTFNLSNEKAELINNLLDEIRN